MNQLMVQNYGFTLIPKPAEKQFIGALFNWYESSIYEEDWIPLFENNMLWQEEAAISWLSNTFDEIRAYTYTREMKAEFPDDQFPVDTQKFIDCRFDEEQSFIDVTWSMEFSFYSDMKKFLNYHRMFYTDRYTSEEIGLWDTPPTQYFNIPVKEVW